ncbi:MAG: S24 family peptidase [Paracoccus sp. (in: a-proteobacteria)]|uniref:S24 family peptidase n=1 Tax=Paracoccus sp. TaxID=267 RepID=UPI0039E23415
MDFAEIVLRQLKALNLNINQAELSRGLPQGYIRGVVRDDDKRAVPNVQKAEQIASALGMEFYIGPPREIGSVVTTEISGTNYVAIPRFDAHLSAGSGIENGEAPAIGSIAFRRDWVERENLSASQTIAVSVRGDSMEPTLSDGDLVLIDQRKRTPTGRRIYALIGPEGEALVKRLEYLPGALLLHSDNASHPTQIITPADAERVKILGEVVWWGHKAKE